MKAFNKLLNHLDRTKQQINKQISTLSHNEYLNFFKPLFWPNCLRLRLLVAVSILSVLCGLVVNVFVPIYSQKIVDGLTLAAYANSKSKVEHFSISTLAIYLVLKILQGVGTLSLLNIFQSFVWIKLEQNARKHVQLRFFDHLHKMSVGWQLNHKTGDILGCLDRGTSGVTSIIEHGLYSIFPTVANIVIAILYLSAKFNFKIGLLVLFQIVLYLWVTFQFTEWRSRFQKRLNNAEDAQKQQAMESLLNFETVKLYANEEFEKNKYSGAIDRFQFGEFEVLASLNGLQLIQLLIVNLGLVVGSVMIVLLILDDKTLTVGDYMLFTSYMAQLMLPLNYLGNHYRSLRISRTDLESMMEILRDQPELKIFPGSKKLLISDGEIEFRNVDFGHGSLKKVLRGISFKIPARKTIALVGKSGAGKSSIVRLLTRLYDSGSGEIFIDGQNLKTLIPNSLRRSIGVVPQDTILFHDTIKNNIKYAKLDASDYEVILAAQSAQINDTIMSLPEGYDTLVGERGLKLSGGEKQRIAIARMFLKNPPIIILDEATSSLDATTETEILSSFAKLCRNRTSLVVTHRLQSIQKADEILVLKDGEIVESGNHSQLLTLKGEYYCMWSQQNQATHN